MTIIDWADQSAAIDPGGSCTIGVFDGVHAGHRKVLDGLANGPRPHTVVTFNANPTRVLSRADYPGDVETLRQRIDQLRAFDLDVVLLIDFSLEFSTIPSDHFAGLLRRRVAPKELVLGPDFRFGAGATGSAQALESYWRDAHWRVRTVHEVVGPYGPVRSSRIRQAVASGRFEFVRNLLGRCYELDFRDLREDLARTERAVVPVDRIEQVLPPVGEYRVSVRGAPRVLQRSTEVLQLGEGDVPETVRFFPIDHEKETT